MQLTVNGREVDYEIDMSLNSANARTFFFTSHALQKDWAIPALFGFTHYYARVSMSTTPYRAHIVPCMTKYRPAHNGAPEIMECPLCEKDAILLAIWRTMCNKPQAWVVVLIPGEESCKFLDSLEKSNFFFRTRYCDPTIPFDVEKAKSLFALYRKATKRHWNPDFNISRETKHPLTLLKNARMENVQQSKTIETVQNVYETEEGVTKKTYEVQLHKTPTSRATRSSKRLAIQQSGRESDKKMKDAGTKQNKGVRLIFNNCRFVTSFIVSCNYYV